MLLLPRINDVCKKRSVNRLFDRLFSTSTSEHAVPIRRLILHRNGDQEAENAALKIQFSVTRIKDFISIETIEIHPIDRAARSA